MTQVLDAAIGTGLRDDGEATDALCFEAPERVTALHRAHREAGAEVTTTNTFLIGSAPDPGALACAAVACARAAGATTIWGAVSPVGDVLSGARALAQAGVDRVLLETFTDRDALARIVETLVREGVPVAATFAFVRPAPSPAEVARALLSAGADHIGANCGRPEAVVDAVLTMRPLAQAAGAKSIATPAGAPGREFEIAMGRAIRAGVEFVGGCCMTGTQEVRRLRELCGEPCSATA